MRGKIKSNFTDQTSITKCTEFYRLAFAPGGDPPGPYGHDETSGTLHIDVKRDCAKYDSPLVLMYAAEVTTTHAVIEAITTNIPCIFNLLRSDQPATDLKMFELCEC